MNSKREDMDIVSKERNRIITDRNPEQVNIDYLY